MTLPEPERDPAERGARSRLDHNRTPVPAVHDCAHERAAGKVERGVAAAGRGRLRSRYRLAGQHRLVALEVVRLQQPQVGGDDVSHTQSNEIARHELDDVDLLRLPIALDQGGAVDLGVKRLDRPLGAELVHKAEPYAQADDRQDDSGIRRLAHRSRDSRRRDEQNQQEAAELPCQHAPEADTVAAQDIGAELGQRASRLLG